MASWIARAPIDLAGRDIRPGDTFESDEWDPADERADLVVVEELGAESEASATAPTTGRKRK
jgi:hypothetical protein